MTESEDNDPSPPEIVDAGELPPISVPGGMLNQCRGESRVGSVGYSILRRGLVIE